MYLRAHFFQHAVETINCHRGRTDVCWIYASSVHTYMYICTYSWSVYKLNVKNKNELYRPCVILCIRVNLYAYLYIAIIVRQINIVLVIEVSIGVHAIPLLVVFPGLGANAPFPHHSRQACSSCHVYELE